MWQHIPQLLHLKDTFSGNLILRLVKVTGKKASLSYLCCAKNRINAYYDVMHQTYESIMYVDFLDEYAVWK
jgi:hypothetical protein